MLRRRARARARCRPRKHACRRACSPGAPMTRRPAPDRCSATATLRSRSTAFGAWAQDGRPVCSVRRMSRAVSRDLRRCARRRNSRIREVAPAPSAYLARQASGREGQRAERDRCGGARRGASAWRPTQVQPGQHPDSADSACRNDQYGVHRSTSICAVRRLPSLGAIPCVSRWSPVEEWRTTARAGHCLYIKIHRIKVHVKCLDVKLFSGYAP